MWVTGARVMNLRVRVGAGAHACTRQLLLNLCQLCLGLVM